MKQHVYEKRSEFNGTVEALTAFHKDPKVFSRLVPPPLFAQIQRDDRTSLREGEIEFTLWLGPIPIHWLAQHQPGPTDTSFADQMVKGPMAYWRHEHIFESTANGTALTDRVTFAHHPGLRGLLTHLLFDGIPLRLLFFYRHLRTRMALRNSDPHLIGTTQ